MDGFAMLYLSDFWYPVAFSTDVGDRPWRVTACDRALVLYRTASGQVAAASDRCVHRGSSLAGGWVEGECLVCPYHGWQYGLDGTCARIPSQAPESPIPERARIATFPTAERYGYVWVWWGEATKAESVPIPDLPHSGNRALRAVCGTFRWQAHYTRVIENALDFAHAPFVHAGAFGNPDLPEVPPYEVEAGDRHASAAVWLTPSPPGGLWGWWQRERTPKPVLTRLSVYLPNLTVLEVNLAIGILVLYGAHVPVGDRETLTLWTARRSFFTGAWADGDARRRTLAIFRQDRPIVEAQEPPVVPLDPQAELHVAADALQVRYRKLCRQYVS